MPDVKTIPPGMRPRAVSLRDQLRMKLGRAEPVYYDPRTTYDLGASNDPQFYERAQEYSAPAFQRAVETMRSGAPNAARDELRALLAPTFGSQDVKLDEYNQLQATDGRGKSNSFNLNDPAQGDFLAESFTDDAKKRRYLELLQALRQGRS